MSLETATYINDLNPMNPLGSDPIAFIDDHVRMIKSVLKNTFPNLNAPITIDDESINDSLRKSGGTLTGPLVLSGDPTAALNPATKQYTDGLVSTLGTTLGNSKVDKTITVSAGSGLTGGGDLSAARTIGLPAVGTAGTKGGASKTLQVTTDAYGRVTAMTEVPVVGPKVESLSITRYLMPGETYVFDASTYAFPMSLSVVITTDGGSNTVGGIEAKWMDAAGATTRPSLSISATNTYSRDDGGSGMADSETAHVPIFTGSTKVEFKGYGGHGSTIEIFAITYYG